MAIPSGISLNSPCPSLPQELPEGSLVNALPTGAAALAAQPEPEGSEE